MTRLEWAEATEFGVRLSVRVRLIGIGGPGFEEREEL